MNAEYTGRKIAELRKEKGLTQKELAKELHVTDKAVSKWERGVNFPDLGLIEKLAEALNSTPSILLGLEDATKEEIVNSFAEISNQQAEDATKDIQKVGWLNLFAGIFLAVGIFLVNRTMEPIGIFNESDWVQEFILVLILAVVIGAIYTLRKYKAIKKLKDVDIILGVMVGLDVYAFLMIQLFTGTNPHLVIAMIVFVIATVCVQLLFYRLMTPHWMKLLPLVLAACWLAWGIYLKSTGWTFIVYHILPVVCCFITWFICRKYDRQKESLLSCLKPFAIVLAVAIVFVSMGSVSRWLLGTTDTSVTILIEEEIQKPISIYVEAGGEEYKLYGNNTIESTQQPLPNNPARTEGVVWLQIGEEKYVILSYLDYVDSPIIEITGNDTVLEVRVYSTVFPEDKVSQTTTINLTE